MPHPYFVAANIYRNIIDKSENKNANLNQTLITFGDSYSGKMCCELEVMVFLHDIFNYDKNGGNYNNFLNKFQAAENIMKFL